jgi:hypothetical protein
MVLQSNGHCLRTAACKRTCLCIYMPGLCVCLYPCVCVHVSIVDKSIQGLSVQIRSS